ncbi:hypothetical protein RIF29_16860 [Crotalaria pallida]|uniref:FLZ-type domain-containing protein n=1 Tax=Crotalaria pallida TaxID=3830 RepID=A0AAN9ICE9_CROPI
MQLGKRPRAPMKRTTSISEITLDLKTSYTDVVEPKQTQGIGGVNGLNNGLDQSRRVMGMAKDYSPRIQRRHSANSAETPDDDFLHACSLCKRRLIPGRDIYMYRGDSGFCSVECRQQQMKQDEKKEKLLVASKKQHVAVAPIQSGSQVTTKGETVAAS